MQTIICYKQILEVWMIVCSCKTFAAKYGLFFLKPGNGISHQVHFERFGIPGKTLLGSDSHTCTGGAMGMLAIGAGGLDVATAMAGEPYYLKFPRMFGVKLTGKLQDWASGKDIILEMLRRHSVKGGVGYIIEYFGTGVKHLSATDRATIANMGAESGATTTIFPSDNQTKRYLQSQERGDTWVELRLTMGQNMINWTKSICQNSNRLLPALPLRII